MQRRTLQRGQALWEQGQPAHSIGIVEGGKLGIVNRRAVLAVLYPGMVVGEASILTLDGPPAHRSASVMALEDATVVAEYPASMVKEAFGVGVPRQVLRSLFGQICRNALIVLAEHSGEAALDTLLRGLIQGMRDSEERLRGVKTWEGFLVTFRTLYHLRDATNAIREDLVARDGKARDTIVRASATMRTLFKSDDVQSCIEAFLQAEREAQAESPTLT